MTEHARPARPRRQLPRWSELKPMLVGERPTGSPVERRMARAYSIDDLRTLARRRAPRAVFEYVDGGAESELTMARSRAALDAVQFAPHVLRDVSAADPGTTIQGRPAALPVVLAPTGLTKAMHHEGELAVGRAARDAGLPYALSTMGTTSIEELAAEVPTADRWFQLYLWRDRAAGKDLLQRAAASGFTTLILTVDVPVSGGRLRDQRNGFTMPPTLRAKTIVDMGMHPSWWLNMLTSGPLTFATMSAAPSSVADTITRMFDPAVTFDDLGWLRENWSGSIVVKGIQRVDDAVRVADAGVDGIVLSNHGGRQLDRTQAPLTLLPRVRDRLQDSTELYIDGSIRSGADVAAAVGLGADAVLIGRAYLYGLMAGGEAGVRRSLALLRQEFVRTMQLLGVREVSALRSGVVALDAPSAEALGADGSLTGVR
ncbi:alpha-hydroxy acid oxidase [Blastococcus brunescens]|uniref:Alpha-hydroxy acid oxidase n=1 Tax=Blastococcus brunescens TaxID=1564165 RepID=A0ABZ1AYV6_9ACTN|nr:alpha-hydroxy acid oxidase [Blastococcus sp. BMG 8361]WRL62284.1 alpha-hydroxy acid oxidase [Blastococcus sp. BMG 8361]